MAIRFRKKLRSH